MGPRKVLRGLGKTFISAGLLILLFVAYQLWGTGITESRAQDRLKKQFDSPVVTLAPASPTAPTTTPPPVTAPIPGEALALLRIPKIGVDVAVVEGVGVSDLQHGPGHYPGSALPGQPGNAAIAGHRTTYGAPFYRLNELKPGDEIQVRTRGAAQPFEYRVTSSASVDPSDVAVLNPTPDNRLTLTTCTPRYTATQRLIVVAALVSSVDVRPPPPTTTVAPKSPPSASSSAASSPGPPLAVVEGGLSGQGTSTTPAVLWGIVCAAVWALGWVFGQRWRRWAAYALTTPVFMVCLFFFFQNFARFVPANI